MARANETYTFLTACTGAPERIALGLEPPRPPYSNEERYTDFFRCGLDMHPSQCDYDTLSERTFSHEQFLIAWNALGLPESSLDNPLRVHAYLGKVAEKLEELYPTPTCPVTGACRYITSTRTTPIKNE